MDPSLNLKFRGNRLHYLLITQDRVTIIHGPNGVGKITIIKLIADLFAKQFQSIRVCPYQKLEFEFEKPRCNLSIKMVVPKVRALKLWTKFLVKNQI
jgi:predicted ATP-binding protein involved in virulence